MTALDQRPRTAADPPAEQTPPASTPAASVPPPVVGPPVRRPGLTAGRSVALSFVLLGLLVLGFLAYLFGFSSVSYDRQQTNLRKTLNKQLANATAPVNPTKLGAPIAAMDIPALDIHTMIVVEGTGSRQLMSGPGLLPSSPLPGQVGSSIILGKRTTFGGPFADLAKLDVGDRIRITTGLGVATYRVSSFGTTRRPPPANSSNRLLLYTADSTTWSPLAVAVSADLTSTPVTGGVAPPGLTSPQQLGHRDYEGSMVPLAGWAQLLLITAVLMTIGFARWPRWPVLLCLGPVLVAVLWSVYENAAGLLPNFL